MKYLFLVYLFAEVMLTTTIASSIGGFVTFLEILFSAFLGMALLVNMRYTLSVHFQALMQQKISPEAFASVSLWSFLGALLLILPGFLTDIVGVLLQWSVISTLFANRALHVNQEKPLNQPFHGDVIDVEVIEDHPPLK